jgi:hypothetical protein
MCAIERLSTADACHYMQRQLTGHLRAWRVHVHGYAQA